MLVFVTRTPEPWLCRWSSTKVGGEGDAGAGQTHHRRAGYGRQCKEKPLKVSWKESGVIYLSSGAWRAGVGMAMFGLAAELTN